MLRLHVNVDHVATLRQARRGVEPDPVAWALAAERAGADGITVHLRKDRRHIQDSDVRELRKRGRTILNLECSLDQEMVGLALESGARVICLVPERREELTTEGGLDVVLERERIAQVLPLFAARGALVSLFVDPETRQLEAAAKLGAPFVELHTGSYAGASDTARTRELERLSSAATRARELGLRVNAGHGLNLANTRDVALIGGLEELNIGYSIVARALFVGVEAAVREMLHCMGRSE
ncbi:MAG TPA: pyridoxine 5'-phosphate synthase [Planctomycetota bacterium]|nr:pyridoxine 5'-phosphate synthase [Planctomycetota bacterium]